MAGWRKTLEVLPAVVVCGVSFAAVQFYVSNYIGPELTDILSSLGCIGAMVAGPEVLEAAEHLPARRGAGLRRWRRTGTRRSGS